MFGGTSTVRTIQTLLTAKDDGATSKLAAVERQGDQTTESIERTEQQLSSVTQAMAVTGTATAALGGGILALNSRFAKLDETFATIRETSGATTDEMEQIREATKGVATDLPVSLSQSAAAARELSFAGLSATETMTALNETSQLAVASNLQAGEAAQTVARSLNAFELEARQTDAVVGALGQTFSDSATNIQSLSQGLTEVQATANAAGLSVAETTASLGLLASSGLAGSKAGTSLNATLRKLTSGSGQTKQALDELGISIQDFTDESGSLRDLPAIMQTLSGEMNDVESQAERLRIANQLVGSEGARALLPMIRNTEDLTNRVQNNLRAEIQGAIGDISRMNDTELETTSGALGVQVSDETTGTELISNLQRLANEEGENAAQIASRLQIGLGLTGDAAEMLAQDITQTNKSAEELASALDATTTAEELAEAQTRTLSGQMTQLRSDLQVIGYEMQQGTKPALSAVVGGMRNLTTPIAENEGAAKALGAGLVGLTAVTGTATAALGAHAAQLKLSTLALTRHASQTYVGTAALWAQTAATTTASKATWLLTASTSQLRRVTMLKTASLWFSTKAQYASAAAALSNATAMGVLSTATTVASGALTTMWSLLGPVGWAVLGLAGAGAALAAIWKGDLFGAGEEAGAALAFVGDKAGMAWAATKQLLGIVWELARIGGTLGGLALTAPIAGLLKLPGLIRDVGPKAKKAAMRLTSQIVSGLAQMGPQKYAIPILGPMMLAKDIITDPQPWIEGAQSIPPSIIAGLGRMGPWKYAIPILGPMMLAKDMITNPNRWITAGQQIPMMLAEGIAQTAGSPVEEVTEMVGEARDFLPFSPAKEGPLSDLNSAGPALVSTIADGVESEQGQLTSTVGAMFEATPLGMAAGAASDAVQRGGQSPRSVQKYDITLTSNITLEGGAEGSTEQSIQRAAETGTSKAFEDFIRRLQRET
jgi:TP901 family phage tail tape measure protein